MTRVVVVGVLLFIAIPSGVLAQAPAYLGVYSDAAATECEIMNDIPEFVSLHLWLLPGTEMTANTVQFYAPTPECWSATWFGDNIPGPFLYLYTTHDATYGITITFTECRDLPLYLGSMNFWATGTSTPCCHYEILPTFWGQLEIVDCSIANYHDVAGIRSVINPDETCRCNRPVSAKESTWGGIKALYR